MVSVQDTKLIRTRVGGDPHTLVLRRTRDESAPVHLLVESKPTDVLAVTHGDPAALLERLCDRVGGRPRNAGVVSVGGRMRSASASGPSGESDESNAPNPPGGNVIRGVADPADASGVLDATLGYLEAWPRDGRTVVYFDSVTRFLDDMDADPAVDFLAGLLRALSERDAVGYFCLTPSVHDCATVRAVTSLFDTMIERIDDATAGSDARPAADFGSGSDPA